MLEISDSEKDIEVAKVTDTKRSETDVALSTSDDLKPIPEKLSEKESESLLSQFFGNAEVNTEPTPAANKNVPYHKNDQNGSSKMDL